MKNLGVVEWVDISVAIIGLIVSVTAVVISVLALKQTKKSIEEANRPYVVVYRDYIQTLNTLTEYVIIKNFGKTGAIIDSIKFDPDYKEEKRDKGVFSNISGTFVAPGQSISTVGSNNAFNREKLGLINVTINYHNGKKAYQEVIDLNDDFKSDLWLGKPSPGKPNSLEDVVAKATQEILRRRL